MPIPLHNTRITITRSTATGTTDLYDAPDAATETIATGIRAAIDPPSGISQLVAGQRVEYTARMNADPCDLQAFDTVTATDGTTWTVLWARTQTSLGISYVEADLRLVQGFAA
jgi:hypothetical protein